MIMNSCNEIGGYFGLEINSSENFQFDKSAILLNTARNCLRYVIRAFNIKAIKKPYYTRPVVWKTIKKEGCEIKFYHIGKDFLPLTEFDKDEFILYTNYFGICAKNVKLLAEKYKNLIIDNAQAFYMPKYGIASFNSVRKFFGVPDGAILYSNKKTNENFEIDTSYNRCSHLLKRIDVTASFGYSDFCKNDDSLSDEPIKYMSNLTKAVLAAVDTEKAKQKRFQNFKVLSEHLNCTNKLDIQLDDDDVPMVYPYLVKDNGLKQRLIKNKIYVATYWNSLPDESIEGEFQKYLVPLPVDQRYDEIDMKRIIEVIND